MARMSRPLTTGPLEGPSGRTSATAPQLDGGTVAVPRLELCVEREAGQPTSKSVVLDGEFFRIGSHPVNNLVINDRLVSRFHCSLTRSATGFRLSDTGSLNGTRVGGVRVRDADLPLPECSIEIGDSLVRVRDLGSGGEVGVSAALSLGALYGISVPMRRLFDLIKRVAKSSSDVLVEGESGTGKELVARAIHDLSARAKGPFRAINCAALPPNLLESELFGHVRGSFTGAVRDDPGIFRAADGGTLFLDEVAEMPLEVQAKLLRVLETKTVIPVGGRESIPVDVRIVAATHTALRRAVEDGAFRADLMYRLRVVPVFLPPLRDRKGDVLLLLEKLIEDLNKAEGRQILHVSAGARSVLTRYAWPGNVRELRNVLEYAYVIGDGPVLVEADLPPELVDPDAKAYDDEVVANLGETPAPSEEPAEVARIRRALERAGGNRERAARMLGMSRVTLWRRLKQYGIETDETESAPEG
ncbi:MAG: sigma 54-interacting transcriptional regulator [Sandaracinaceae bacterium]|nr:sigma 54-interacting transcriptional regulator [Sandaracinaceae bacterium]